MNVQVLTDSDGCCGPRPALPGSAHDLTAARTHGIVDALPDAGLKCWADKAYQGAGRPPIRVPFRGCRLKRWKRRHNSSHAKMRCLGEQAMATLKGWRLLRKLAAACRRYRTRLWDAVMPGDEVIAEPDEVVPAGLIRQLAMGLELPGRPHRLRLRGVRITGDLDFEAATLLCPLELTDCDLDVINTEQAQAPVIWLAHLLLRRHAAPAHRRSRASPSRCPRAPGPCWMQRRPLTKLRTPS